MASLLSGVELMQDMGFYSVVFPFILIVAIVYGLLSYLKPFGENIAVNMIISAMFGLLFISARSAVRFVSMLIPYIMVVFIVITMLLVIFRFLGADDELIGGALRHTAGWGAVVGVLIVGIFIFISMSFPALSPSNQGTTSSGGTATTTNALGETVPVTQDILRNTIFHPTIVGIIVMVLVFGAATYVITSRQK